MAGKQEFVTISLAAMLLVSLSNSWADRTPDAQQDTTDALLTVTFESEEAFEFSIARFKMKIRPDRPVILLRAEVVREEEVSPLFSELYSRNASRFYAAWVHDDPNAIVCGNLTAGQYPGSHSYGRVIGPKRAWEGPWNKLGFPVGAGGNRTVKVRIAYVVLEKEWIEQNCVIFGEDARRVRSYQDAMAALESDERVMLYLNPYKSGPAGESLETPVLEERAQDFALTLEIRNRPVSFEQIVEREERQPQWYFDGSWIFQEADGSATLVSDGQSMNFRSIRPGFFTTVTSRMLFHRISFYANEAAFLRSFPHAEFQHPMGGPYLKIGSELGFNEFLEYSKRFDDTEFFITGPSRHGRCYISSDPNKGVVDSAVVAEKIGMLGLRDDTLDYQEQPLRWLKQRRDKIVPQLIEGLDSPEARVGRGCLKVLDGLTYNSDVLSVLLRIAGDREHPVNHEATLSLCGFADYEDAKDLLEKALTDTERFTDSEDRAMIAEALGREEQAVRLLVPLLEDRTKRMRAIVWLGDIGHESAIEPLEKLSRDPKWEIASGALLSLAQIDPDEYGLTEDQETFLFESRRGFKANRSIYVRHWKGLAELNRGEIRPFVIRMLDCDRPEPALIVLQLWQDQEAIDDIRRGITAKRGWRRRVFIAAYINIEGTEESINDVLRTLKRTGGPAHVQGGRRGYDESAAEDAILGVAQSIMSDDRKLEVCRRFRDGLDHEVVARNLRGGGGDMSKVLIPLINEETHIGALGIYAQAAASDPKKRFGKDVRAALDKLASMGTIISGDGHGARLILDACAAYELEDSGRAADRIMDAENPMQVRMAAARVSANLGGNRKKALALLYEQLGSSDTQFCMQASGYLNEILCIDNAERNEREGVILLHLGQPTEDYALRVLTTCQGQKSAGRLGAIMDQQDAARAVYAAWILAQHPDDKTRKKALRRIAVFAMFNHQVYQQGAGIDFQITADISFHQTSARTKTRRPATPSRGRVHIPEQLLVPFEFDGPEQIFAVRSYRYCRLNNRFHDFPPHYLQWRTGGDISWDASHLGLFRVIAREDPYLGILHVKGQKIAHFANRKAAAEIVAEITDANASYTGLAGEEIDSREVPPGPYENQNELIAQFALDQIDSVLGGLAANDIYNRRRESLGRIIRGLTDSLGSELKNEVIAESRRRNMSAVLKSLGFAVWLNMDE